MCSVGPNPVLTFYIADERFRKTARTRSNLEKGLRIAKLALRSEYLKLKLKIEEKKDGGIPVYSNLVSQY